MEDNKPNYVVFSPYNENYKTKINMGFHLGTSGIFNRTLTEEEIKKYLNQENQFKFAVEISKNSVREITNGIRDTPTENFNTEKTFTNGTKDVTLKARVPSINLSSGTTFNNSTLEGKKLILQKGLGTTSYIDIPLYHSGFHISLNNVTMLELLELYRLKENNKIEVLSYPLSTIFNNVSKKETILLLDFIKEHIRSTSLDFDFNDENDNIFNYISILDIPILINFMSSLIWNDGFRYVTQCENKIKDVNEDEENSIEKECGATIEAIINFNSINFTDYSKLTDKQLIQLSKKTYKSVSKQDIEEYKNTLYKTDNTEVLVTGDNTDTKISITLKMSSIADYIQSCEQSQSRLEIYNNRLLSETEAKRVGYLRSFIKEESSLSYFHFIDKFIIHTLAKVVDDEYEYVKHEYSYKNLKTNDEEIFNIIIQEFSKSESAAEKLNTAIQKFISENVISFIGRPPYQCPSCNGINGINLSNDNYLGIVPINPINVFFESLDTRIRMSL